MHRVLFASGLAAIAGAVIWGGITYFTGYEIGYVAWGIGALVGGAAAMVGGAGKNIGVLCAGLALGSIFAGKMMAVQFSAPAEVRKMMDVVLTKDNYEEHRKDASDFAALKSNAEHAGFMVEHGYSDAKKAADVPQAQLAEFRNDSVPMLEEMEREKPSFEQWKEKQLAVAMSVVSAGPVMENVVQNLNGIDLLFAFLGLATAYRIPAGRTEAAA